MLATPFIRVLLVDNHPFLRQGVATTLEETPDIEVCGEAPDSATALELADQLNPDVVITDLNLPDKTGLEFVRLLIHGHSDIKILILSMHEEEVYAERCLRAGAKGYLMKCRHPANIVGAIREIASGRLYLSQDLSQRMLSVATQNNAPASDREDDLSKLSDREFEVFELIGRGKTAKETAHMLGISSKTVDVHRHNIRHKMNVQTNPDLIRHAVRWVESTEGSMSA